MNDCQDRFGSSWTFKKAYELIVGRPLPAGEDHTSQTAMTVLHAVVIQLHTIEESTTEILRSIEGFEIVVHWTFPAESFCDFVTGEFVVT